MAAPLLVTRGWPAGCREKRRFLLFWSAVFAGTSFFMTFVTYAHGPDPHDYFGCSVPFAMWLGCLLVATLSCYTTDYIRCAPQPLPAICGTPSCRLVPGQVPEGERPALSADAARGPTLQERGRG